MFGRLKIDWLKGVRVLLNAHYIPGPTAAFLLKSLGAEVIKVEPPFGDLMRKLPPFIEGKEGKRMSAYFRSLNAGFKSISLNFKSKEDVVVFKELIKASNVLIDGNRANYLTKKVLECEIHEINPDIIHIPITAYGLKGPMKDAAGHDNNILALSGNLSYNPIDHRGLPSIFGSQLVDINSGYLAAFAALAAVYGQQNSNSLLEINTVDVSMLHVAFFLNQIQIAAMNITGKSPLPEQEILNGGLANYRMYGTSDGKGVFFGAIEKNLFENFCIKINRNDLCNKKNDELINELDLIFKSKTLQEWQVLLQDVDCCFTPVNSLQQAVREAQIEELELTADTDDEIYGSLNLARFPAGFTEKSLSIESCIEPAPELNQHDEEIRRVIIGHSCERSSFARNNNVLFRESKSVDIKEETKSKSNTRKTGNRP